MSVGGNGLGGVFSNGVSREWFIFFIGLRKENFVLFFFLIIVIDVLDIMLERIVEVGVVEVFRVGREEIYVFLL